MGIFYLRLIDVFYVFILVGIICVDNLKAQTIHPDWEKYLEQYEDSSDQSQLLDQLEDLLKNPLNLNTASLQDMLMIPGFPEQLANRMIEFRKKGSGFLGTSQVKEILNIDEELWLWISRFITVRVEKKPIQWQADSRIRFSHPIDRTRGYIEKKFAGTPVKIYQRYRAGIPGRFQISTLFKKDGGESNISDHRVYNIEYEWQYLRSRIIAGTYTINLGMGLMLWSPFAVRKGSAPFYSVRRSDRIIRPYTSSFESNYFRGFAFHSKPGNWEFAGWYSTINHDAGLTENGQISNFYENGLHRTDTERQKQNQAHVVSLGGSLGTTILNRVFVQLSTMKLNFNPPIAWSDSEPQDWSLSGKQTQVSGINIFGELGLITIFGEAVWQQSSGTAFLIGGKRGWKKTKLLLLYRNYSPKYDNPYAQGFGEWSRTNNETGWYTAWQFSPHKTTKITLAADQFRTTWRTFGSSLPLHGSDIYLQLEQRINRSLRFYIRYTNDNKGNTISRQTVPLQLRELIIPEQRDRLRLHFRITLPIKSEINGRLETSQFFIQPESNYNLITKKDKGWLFYWDFRTKYFSETNIVSRISFFDTPNYDTRIYQFESDLPGVLSSKLLYGRGQRFYLLINWQLKRQLRLTAKYASTRYENRESIGSGWNLLNSPVDHSFAIQIDLEF